MGHSLKILGRTSSINVRKVLWTCQELGIDYVREDWGIGFKPTQSPDFLALNPNAQVPVLIDDHGVLWESNTICRYLVGLYQRHDLPPNSTPRGAMRSTHWCVKTRTIRTRNASRRVCRPGMTRWPC